jgi:hypothetical protein
MSKSLLENVWVLALKRLPSSLLARMHSRRFQTIAIVLSLLLSTFAMGWIAVATSHAYLPLAGLGVFYGTMFSYPAIKLLSPRLQSALGGLLGGISLGNISNRIATGESAVRSLSRFIAATVQQVFTNLPGIEKAQFLEDGVVLCIWMAIVTMFLFVAANAYLGEGSTPAKTAVGSVSPSAQAPANAAVPTINTMGAASGS